MRKQTVSVWTATILVCACAGVVQAATWTGNGSVNNGGSFNDAANWGGTLPGSSDAVTLPNVTSGDRVITVDSAISISSLVNSQTTSGATNALTLNAPLSLTTTANTNFGENKNSTAGTAAEVLNLNGHSLSFTGSSGAKLYNSVSFNGDNSMIDNPRVGSGTTYNSTTFDFYGPVSVSGMSYIKQDFTGYTGTNDSNQGTLKVNINASASLNITSGSLTINKSPAKQNVGSAGSCDTTFTNSGTTLIGTGTSLNVTNTTPGGTGSSAVYLVNANVLTQAGTVQLVSRGANNAQSLATITNSGTWTVSGTAAAFQRGSSINVPTTATGAFVNAGILQGTGSADALGYVSQLSGYTTQRMAMNNTGTIAPGAGTNGIGTGSIGTLTLKGTDVTFGTNGKLSIDIGGTDSGQYDVLTLAAGDVSGTSAGTLDLSATGDTLDIHLVNGFAPTSSFSLALLNYGTLGASGTQQFDNVLVNGVADARYTVVYSPTSATLVAAIPEPAMLSLLGVIGAGLAMRRRR